jgi:hypothetical protein
MAFLLAVIEVGMLPINVQPAGNDNEAVVPVMVLLM